MRPAAWLVLLLPLPGTWLPGHGQPTPAARPPKAPARSGGRPGTLRSFVPAAYEVHTKEKADLDLDGRPDVLLILNPKNESKRYWGEELGEEPMPPRLLLVLTGTADRQQYQVRVRSATAVYRYGHDGNFLDCLEEVKVGRGWFCLFHYGGTGPRWYRSTTFTYQPATATWRLSADIGGSFEVMAPEHPHEENLLRHHVPLSRFDIDASNY